MFVGEQGSHEGQCEVGGGMYVDVVVPTRTLGIFLTISVRYNLTTSRKSVCA